MTLSSVQSYVCDDHADDETNKQLGFHNYKIPRQNDTKDLRSKHLLKQYGLIY